MRDILLVQQDSPRGSSAQSVRTLRGRPSNWRNFNLKLLRQPYLVQDGKAVIPT